jgi:hypothetical protein
MALITFAAIFVSIHYLTVAENREMLRTYSEEQEAYTYLRDVKNLLEDLYIRCLANERNCLALDKRLHKCWEDYRIIDSIGSSVRNGDSIRIQRELFKFLQSTDSIFSRQQRYTRQDTIIGFPRVWNRTNEFGFFTSEDLKWFVIMVFSEAINYDSNLGYWYFDKGFDKSSKLAAYLYLDIDYNLPVQNKRIEQAKGISAGDLRSVTQSLESIIEGKKDSFRIENQTQISVSFFGLTINPAIFFVIFFYIIPVMYFYIYALLSLMLKHKACLDCKHEWLGFYSNDDPMIKFFVSLVYLFFPAITAFVYMTMFIAKPLGVLHAENLFFYIILPFLLLIVSLIAVIKIINAIRSI